MVKLTGKASDFLKIGVATAGRGDIDGVRAILKARPNWVHHVGSHGRTMLWEACHRGKLSMVKYLVRRRSDIDACGTYYTPYFVEVACYCIARYKKHHESADYLLDNGAAQNMHMAAFLGDLALVKKFLRSSRTRLNRGHPQHEMAGNNDEGLDVIQSPAKWATPLCYALRGGDLPTIQYLIDRRAIIKGIERELFIAANDNLDAIKLLLENGADPKHAGKTPMRDRHLKQLFKTYGLKVPQSKLSEELVYLCRGDRGGDPVEVRRMLNEGANIDHQDRKGKTALHRAAKAGFLKTIDVLLEFEASLDIGDCQGETPLFDAVRSTIKNEKAQAATIRRLKKAGCDINHHNLAGLSALDVAIRLKRSNSKAIAKLVAGSRR